jgi:hypothetical protein
MAARLDELEGELATLLDALRGSGDRLREGLAQLHEQLGAAAEPSSQLRDLNDREASGAADVSPQASRPLPFSNSPVLDRRYGVNSQPAMAPQVGPALV